MARAADQKATLITCDIAKAGAVQQLAIYARALGVPAYFARDAAALRRAVQRASPDSSIIIDTIGANPFAKAERDALRELAAASGAEPVLVQPCGGDPEEAAELAQCHAEIGVQRLIATRLDASRRLGGILAAADRAPLAFGALSMSPEIAAGLAAPDAATLSARLLPHIGHETQREQTSVPGSPS
jgi:flagellar biosynthesis protein FlhF